MSLTCLNFTTTLLLRRFLYIFRCRLIGAVPYVTAGSSEKIERCKELGAENGFNYKDETVAWSDALMAAVSVIKNPNIYKHKVNALN